MRDVVLLIVGLVVLTFAADRFVLGAARLSAALRVSPVVVGALVIGFGTSAPELLVTVLAAAQDAADLGYGNLVGSNTANILLVLGSAALLSPITVRTATLKREVPLMLAAVGAFALATLNGQVGLVEGLVLLTLTVAVIALVLRVARRDQQAAAQLAADVEGGEAATGGPLWRHVGLALGGLVGTIAGAQALVVGATGVARMVGISDAVIGLTVVAIGTSLPELVTAVAAARRGEPELVLGNVRGSNIFNALPVAGIAAMLTSTELDPAFGLGVAAMVGSCLLASVFLLTGRRLGRREGATLLALFVAITAATVV